MHTTRDDEKNFFTDHFQPWMICIVAMLFYCYNYFLRISPSVMQNDLTQTFHITATQFGTLAGFYYYVYTPMQLPAGMIYDKFGARIVLFLACIIAIAGLSIFISSSCYATASLGRFLIGFGMAFSYIGVLKLGSVWLPPNRFATIAGLTTAVGMMFGALSQIFLTKIVEVIGYRHALHTALLIGLVLSIVLLLTIRNKPKRKPNAGNYMQSPLTFKQLVSVICALGTNHQMWLIGIVGCLLYLPSSVFLDLWGIPYLRSVYGMSADQAVYVTNITYLGWIISGPIIGMLSDKIKLRRLPLIISSGLASIFLCFIFYMSHIPLFELYVLFFLVGICCGAHPLCFALAKENNSQQISGTAIAVTNMLIMLGGAIFQPVVGKLLDIHTLNPVGPNGLPLYASSDYTFALSIIPLGVLLGFVLSIFIKETNCRAYEKRRM